MKEEIKEILSLCEDFRKAMDDFINMMNSDKVRLSADSKTLEYLDIRLNLAYEKIRLMIGMLEEMEE